MARLLYGATSGDYTMTAGGRVIPNAEIEIWDAIEGGTQITDLTDYDGNPCTVVTSGGDGLVRFYGPDGENDNLWMDTRQGSRLLVRPTVLTSTIADGSILDEDIAADADIDRSKIAGTALTSGSTGVFSVLDYGADPTGVADSTAEIQAALDAGEGATVLLPSGTYSISATLAVPADTRLLMDGATIVPTMTIAPSPSPGDSTMRTVTLAEGSTLQGGKIVSQEVWNAVNLSAPDNVPHYAVVYTLGSKVTIRDVTLVNVPRVGIAINGDDTTIAGCRIYGNAPVEAWTSGTGTNLHGIFIDPAATASNGNVIVSDNIITGCVQGLYTGNFGAGSPGTGLVFTGNVVEGCWDHGIYIGGGNGYTVVGNAFNACRNAIVTTGANHVVTGNTVTTLSTGDTNDVQGIMIRDAINCIVSDNTISGDGGESGVALAVYNVSTTEMYGNVIANNTVNVTGTSTIGLRVGTTSSTVMCDNAITGNVIRASGQANQIGALHVVASGSATKTSGNTIIGNTVVSTQYEGISVAGISQCIISHNVVTFEYDWDTPTTKGQIFVTAGSDCVVSSNILNVSASWGADTTLRAIWFSSSTRGGLIENNLIRHDTTKATSVPFRLDNTTSPLVRLNEAGLGAPAWYAATGSVWRRTDGAAGTILYAKQSGADSSGWAAVPELASNNVWAGTSKFSGYVGFYGTAPVAKPTGVAVSAAGIHAALVSLGLIAGP